MDQTGEKINEQATGTNQAKSKQIKKKSKLEQFLAAREAWRYHKLEH